MHQKLHAAHQEKRAINSAAYGLARHLKYLQSQLEQGAGSSSKQNPISDHKSADDLVDEGIDSLKLSESLGASQSEAEVIAYLRPLRRSKG